MSKDPGLAEKFRDAVTQGADNGGGVDSVLRNFSLSAVLSTSTLAELSPLERLVFCTPFLTLLFTPSSASPAAIAPRRTLGLESVAQIQLILSAALDQLGSPAVKSGDLPDLSPLPISKLLSILLSDLPTTEDSQAFTDEQRRAIVMATVRGRLGAEVGSQALTHALVDMHFNSSNSPSPIAVLTRLAPSPALCSIDLVRAVLARFAQLGEHDNEGGGNELRVAAMMFELMDVAEKQGVPNAGIDLGNWVKAVHEVAPSLRWADVTRALDSPSRAALGNWSLSVLATILTLSPSPADGTPNSFPTASAPGGSSAISGLWTSWTNPSIQYNLLERLLRLPTESFSLPSLPSIRRVIASVDFVGSSPSILLLSTAAQASIWNCRDLTSTLMRLSAIQSSSMDISDRARDALEVGCKDNPELVLLALVQMEVCIDELYLCSMLLTSFPLTETLEFTTQSARGPSDTWVPSWTSRESASLPTPLPDRSTFPCGNLARLLRRERDECFKDSRRSSGAKDSRCDVGRTTILIST